MKPAEWREQANALIELFKSTYVFGKWPYIGYRDNWLFIAPGWDLQEDRCTKSRLHRQVDSLGKRESTVLF